MRNLALAVLFIGGVTLAGCGITDSPSGPEALVTTAPEMSARGARKAIPLEMDQLALADIESRLTDLAYQKAAEIAERRAEAGVTLPEGVGVAPLGFSWTGSVDGQTVGTDVFFLDRGNKQIPVQWVPGDPRRNGRTDIGYAFVDFLPQVYGTDFVTPAETMAAIDDAMDTWANQACSEGLDIPKGTFFDWIFFDSDVLHDGFYDLGPGVLGVTIPFIFLDGSEPTDIDNDGSFDYAYAIILYSDQFSWGIDTNVFPFIDVETVAFHEMGHGLGQAHFGTAFQTLSNGKIHFAPRSVMNAAYSGLQQAPTGTDIAGHCSMYGSWPNN